MNSYLDYECRVWPLTLFQISHDDLHSVLVIFLVSVLSFIHTWYSRPMPIPLMVWSVLIGKNINDSSWRAYRSILSKPHFIRAASKMYQRWNPALPYSLLERWYTTIDGGGMWASDNDFSFYNSPFSPLATLARPCKWNQPWHTPSSVPDKG